MSDIAIRVEGLGKQFRIGARQEQYKTFREAVTNTFLSPARRASRLLSRKTAVAREHAEMVWALRDISFEVKCGDVVGIIGRNGAGKSTLLKILSRITEPTTGYAAIRGRVGALLEVGTGFHAELTGRENTYLNGAILGMSRQEIDRKFDEIVQFAEVERFIDTPVKHYSSGMYLRLAFAVAAHLEPEIMVVDEVLAVGDAAFQKKSLGKMADVAQAGRTVLFVSHNMGAVSTLCTRGILLEQGRVALQGTAQEAVSRYLSNVIEHTSSENIREEDLSKAIQIRRVAVKDESGATAAIFDVFDPIYLEIEYDVRQDLKGSNLSLLLLRDGLDVFNSFDVDCSPEFISNRPKGHYKARIKLLSPLKAGTYSVTVGAGFARREMLDQIVDAVTFTVEETSFDPLYRSYARQRPGIIAAVLPWETTRCQ